MLRNALDMTFMTSPENIDLNLNKQIIQQCDGTFLNKSAIITINELGMTFHDIIYFYLNGV